MDRYNGNKIYISQDEQEKMQQTRILIAGAGIGSVIAECALRIGFEDLVIVDSGKVTEESLSCQNYTKTDIGKFKAERLAKRLLRINPNAKIQFHNIEADRENLQWLVKDVKIAINALGFKTDIPFVLDELCSLNSPLQRRTLILYWQNMFPVTALSGTCQTGGWTE